MTNEKPNLYQTLTDRVIELLEDPDIGKWKQPWFPSGVPVNVVSGKAYRGMNVWLLSGKKGGNRWGTYKQWSSVGAQVKKGMKSTIGIYWTILKKEQKLDGITLEKKIPLMRSFCLFHESQVENAPEQKKKAELDPSLRIEEMDRLFAGHGEVKEDGARAYYVPSEDQVSSVEEG